MGLREKALHFKQGINEKGSETLIDKISGPADTEIVEGNVSALDRDGEEFLPAANDSFQDDAVSQEPSLLEDESVVPDIEDEDFSSVENKEFTGERVKGGSHNDISSEGINNKIDDGNSLTDIADNEDLPIYDATEDLLSIEEEPKEDSEHSETEEEEEYYSDENVDELIFQALKDIDADLLGVDDLDGLTDSLLFSVMGILGVTSASVLIPQQEDSSRWQVLESRGVSINKEEIFFSSTSPIIQDVLKSRKLIDIERYKNDAQNSDYFDFIAIDARFLCPLLLTQSVGAILVLGNRITEEEYTSNEFFFVKELMKKSSSVLRRIFEQTSAREQIEQLRQEQVFHNAISRFQQKVEKAQTVDHIKNLILEELNSHSVSCFLLFSYNLKEDGYSVILSQNESPECHVESFHGTIPASSPLVKGLSEIDGPLVIENSQDSPLLRDFSHNGILHNVHESKHYPVMAGNRIFGFLSTFNSNVLTSDQDERISQNLKHALQVMAALKNVSFKGVNFFDSVEIIYRRIEDELVHAREMDIPVTLVLFSIRNYKRFYHLNGLEELNILINEFEKIIQSRMSESDFSARFDRNKILLVLPGKDNKYAVPLANVVKSEISQLLESREKQILVSVLTAEFPSDADNLYDLIDAVD